MLPNLHDKWSRQHVPVAEYEENLLEMTRSFRALTNRDGSSPHVIIVGPPAVEPKAWHRRTIDRWAGQNNLTPDDIPCNRSLEQAKLYTDAAQRAAKAAKVPFVDLCGAMLAACETNPQALDELLSDGLHLSGAGAQLLHSELRRTMDSVPRGALKVDAFRPQFPHHHDIDADNVS